MVTKKIGILVGSLRRESINRKMAVALMNLCPDGLAMEIIEIGTLQLYNQDLDDNPPDSWIEFRKQIKKNDGILFVTPEYNRSVPGALKNAIDIGSRPYGKSIWDAIPSAIVSVSPSAIGAFGANHHLRQSLVFLNVPVMAQPEAYIGNAGKLFNEAGDWLNDTTKEFMRKFLKSFSEFLTVNSKIDGRNSAQRSAS